MIDGNENVFVLCSLLQPMELLWSSLEEWLNILKAEIRKISGSNSSLDKAGFTSPMQTSSHINGQSTLAASADFGAGPVGTLAHMQDLLMNTRWKDSQRSPSSSLSPTDGTKSGSGLLSDTGQKRDVLNGDSGLDDGDQQLNPLDWVDAMQDTDILTAIAPRICAVIQAFYMCCAWQNQQK